MLLWKFTFWEIITYKEGVSNNRKKTNNYIY